MGKKALVIIALLGLAAVVAVAAFLLSYRSFLTTSTTPPVAVEFTIEKGDSFKKVAESLHRVKIISNLHMSLPYSIYFMGLQVRVAEFAASGFF